MTRIGMGFRREIADWTLESSGADCLEVTAEHFFDSGEARLRELRTRFPLYVHGLGLSLGTPGPLDADVLQAFARVSQYADPEWVSDHISFTRAGGIDLGHLNPVPRTRDMAEIIGSHAKEVADACGKPMLLENITAHLDPGGDMDEPEFLNEVCRQGDCGLLLDVTNLYINTRNSGREPSEVLERVDSALVRQLHIVGYSKRGGTYEDSHSAPIQPELMDFLEEVLAHANPDAIILERDEGLEKLAEIEGELEKLRRAAREARTIAVG